MTTLLNNLVAYWPLDGNSNDQLGLRNGVDSNLTYQAGKLGNGALFGLATTSRITIPVLTTGTVFTLSAWLKPPNPIVFGDGWGSIFAQDTNFALFVHSNVVTLYNAGNFPSATLLTAGAWTHVVCIATGSLVSFYINGALDPNSYANVPTFNLVQLGNNSSNECIGGTAQNGMLDEMGVWSRALSGSEVLELYNGGNGISYPFSSAPPWLSVLSRNRGRR